MQLELVISNKESLFHLFLTRVQLRKLLPILAAVAEVNTICVQYRPGQINTKTHEHEISCPDNKRVLISRILSTWSIETNFNLVCDEVQSKAPHHCFHYRKKVTQDLREKCNSHSSCTYNIQNIFNTCNAPCGKGHCDPPTVFHVLYRCIEKEGE